MKRVMRRLSANWKIRKYLALLLVFAIIIVGIKKAPDETDNNDMSIDIQAKGENKEDDISDIDTMIYQYPVELGYPEDYNHNGSGKVDYLKKTYETVSENVRTNTETDDIISSDMMLVVDNYRKLHTSFGDIYCTNSGELDFAFSNNEGKGSAGYDMATIMYSDKTGYILDGFTTAKYVIDNNFYGKLTYNCTDNEGNSSNLISQYLIIENVVPGIQISEGNIYETPGSLNIEVTDSGRIISGIYQDSIQCFVNGNEYSPDDIKNNKFCRLADNLDVSTDTTFSIQFPKDGSYDVEISVSDNCGNTARFKYIISVVNSKVIIS